MTALLLIATLSAACSGARSDAEPTPPGAATTPAATPAPPKETPAATPSSGQDAVAERLAGMSLEEKVGQLFMPVLYGSKASGAHGENSARYGVASPAEVVKKFHLGGVILFPWSGNVESAEQVAGLASGLQKAAKTPLLIGADQENGLVSRLSGLVTDVPGNMAVGATGDPGAARAAAEVTGREMRALGLNVDFAPVADVNVNPANPVIGSRSYGEKPDKVAAMVAAAVEGFHDAGIGAAAKHFPGHGDTGVDSHTGLPVIKHSPAKWRRLDAPPFRAAIGKGVDIVMTAHVVMPELDRSGDPATLSKKIVTGLLRGDLGYDGVVSTDALDMAAVRKKYGDAEVAVRAVLAGVDLLLMPPDLPKAYGAVLAAVKSGRVTRDRLDASVTRLLTLKAERGVLSGEGDEQDPEAVLRSKEHRATAQDIADRAVTVVEGAGDLPLKGDILVTGPAARALAGLLDGAEAVPTADTPTAAQIAAARAAAARSDSIVVTTEDAGPAQSRLVAAMAATGRHVTVVSLSAPYELSRLGGYDTALAVYSSGSASLRAAAKALDGSLTPAGKLPVGLR
ncbi:glycoside hydrolase family 3 protein [Sphaerisporangium rubeum]|uniref:beta-N-acetylhexosaminidase n=1 Tax=Sphaerisporangium rubeum TaxID=321317 RepID=A0A7X0IBD2_9ACTN|nr:beta-N-acetylhexosaminidase [Sphaerisporangium rubeum]